jgi:hypothetical protein
MGIKEIGWESVNCINVVQDMGQWQALVNMVINLLVA